jgi:hypothetical protein
MVCRWCAILGASTSGLAPCCCTPVACSQFLNPRFWTRLSASSRASRWSLEKRFLTATLSACWRKAEFRRGMSQKRRAVGLSCRLPQKYKRGQAALGSIYIALPGTWALTPVVRRSWVMHVLCSHVLWLPSIDQETTYSLTQADNNIIQRPTQLSFKHAVAVHYLWIYASVPTVIASVLVLMQHKHSAQPVTFPMPDQYLVVLLPATGLEKKARTVNA